MNEFFSYGLGIYPESEMFILPKNVLINRWPMDIAYENYKEHYGFCCFLTTILNNGDGHHWFQIVSYCIKFIARKNGFDIIILTVAHWDSEKVSKIIQENAALDITVPNDFCEVLKSDNTLIFFEINQKIISGYIIERNGKFKDFSGQRKKRMLTAVASEIYCNKGVL